MIKIIYRNEKLGTRGELFIRRRTCWHLCIDCVCHVKDSFIGQLLRLARDLSGFAFNNNQCSKVMELGITAYASQSAARGPGGYRTSFEKLEETTMTRIKFCFY
jgi:hypothetical protein